MNKKNNSKLINIMDLIKYFFIIFICLNINNNLLANPKKNYKKMLYVKKKVYSKIFLKIIKMKN